MLCVIDEFTRECLAIRVARKLKATDVIDVLADLLILRGCTSVPIMVPSSWRRHLGDGSLRSEPGPHLEPGSPWEKG